MASLTEAREAPARQLWEEINSIHAGMLGIEGSHQHFQPMAPHADPKTNTIWFFTKTDTDLVQAIRPGTRAHFCVVGKNHDYHACLAGVIEGPQGSGKDRRVLERHDGSLVRTRQG